MTIIVVPDQFVGAVDEAYVHPRAYEQTDSANETVDAQETLNEGRQITTLASSAAHELLES